MQSNDQFENARLHIDFFTMNHDGTEYKGRNSRFMPGKSIRAKFCRDVFQLLTIPAFRENMLVQEYSKENVVCFDTHHPLSIGWTEIDGYYSYSGIAHSSSSAAKYGNQFMRANIQENLQDVLDLFTLIPSETSVPLVAYTVFSILKYFVKSYPSRISPKEPFTTVIRKQGRAMFVSLKGNKAWDIAGAFCGGFTDYGSDNNLSLKKTIISRVHDGIVIIGHPNKDFESFKNKQLIRDACVLCLNSDFPKNENEIVVHTNVSPSMEELGRVNDSVVVLVRALVEYFSAWYQHLEALEAEKCANRILDAFKDRLSKVKDLFEGSEKEILNRIHDEIYTQCEPYFTWKYIKKNKSCEKAFEDIKSNLTHMKGLVDQRCTEFTNMKKRIIYQSENEFRQKLLILREAEEEFGSINSLEYPEKYIYLYMAMLILCRMLQSGGISQEKINQLKDLSRSTLRNLAFYNRNYHVNAGEILNEYISAELLNRRVICVRAQYSQRDQVTGWFDAKKNLIYLPYRTYFDDLKYKWSITHEESFLYNQKELQEELAEFGILITKENGPKRNYLRPECKIIVEPVCDYQQAAETVMKIRIDKLQLTVEASARLQELSKITVPRRSRFTKD